MTLNHKAMLMSISLFMLTLRSPLVTTYLKLLVLLLRKWEWM